ncbi:MAG TPA: C69 family dipeptidase [Candidatus Limosilactobacillus intestinigallinarum]|nr:C69 family dipeptidase [Candidatus Limosilactobacillus intestinigallinarum]
MACTTILAGKLATADGSTLVARNEDFGHAYNPKRFVVVEPDQQPREYQSVTNKAKFTLPANPMRYTAVPEIPAIAKKMGIWGEAGINAANVTMSATETSTPNPRVLGIDPLVKQGVGEEDLVTLVLPYIHSAREGVQLLGQYLAKYGTYESNGVAFSDKDEVWYMETIGGHHWVAQRVPDDCYVVAPNWFAVTTFDFRSPDTMASSDLEQLINDHHLNVDGGDHYNLRHIFGSHNDSDYRYNIPRQWYVQRLFNPGANVQPDDPDLPFARRPEHKLTIEDVKYALSSHYQHTPYDPYSDLGTPAQQHAFRPIGLQRNSEVHILQIRSDVPEKLAGICWLAFGPNAYNALAPFYTNVTDTPAAYRDTKEHFDIANMYWLTHALATIGDEHPKRYEAAIEEMKQNTIAAGRHNLLTTDAAAGNLDGEALQSKLAAANEQTASQAHKLAMKCLGSMVETGSLQIRLNF